MDKIRDIKDRFYTPEAYSVYAESMYMPTWEKFDKRAREYLGKETVSVFGFIEEGHIVGIIAVELLGRDSAEIRGIAVDSAYRKCGIGKQLVQYVCKQLSLSELLAETDDDAVGFYRRCGFETEEFIRDKKYKRYRCVLRVV